MKVIIVGCGRLGVILAERLLRKKTDISIIDNIRASFNSLPPDFEGQTIEGEALNQDVLIRAGIDKADALVAVTNCDPLNAVVAHVARTIFNVPHVVVRNYDPKWRELHELFGFQVISSTAWGAQRIEEMIENEDIKMVYSAGNGEVEIYEFEIPGHLTGQALKEIMNTAEALPVSLTRGGKAILPTLETVLEKDDVLQVSATNTGAVHIHNQIVRS
jgi:trk system potassium uptake protein